MAHRSEVSFCPECVAKVSVKSPKLGQIAVCRVCDTRLEVVDLNPLELDWAFEDSDDDFFDDLDLNLDYDDDDVVYEDGD